jgi:hypothetical protein
LDYSVAGKLDHLGPHPSSKHRQKGHPVALVDGDPELLQPIHSHLAILAHPGPILPLARPDRAGPIRSD